MMNTKFSILYIIGILFLISCGEKKKKRKIYFKNGGLKESGFLLNDSIKVDCYVTFFENGNIESISNFDSLGNLNGSAKYYYSNGKVKTTLNFYRNYANGYVKNYDSLGSLIEKRFYYNDTAVGERNLFHKNRLVTYAFYDFNGKLLNHIEYDSIGKIIKNIRPFLYVFKKELVNYGIDSSRLRFKLLVSRPQRTQNRIFTSFYNKQGKCLKIDSLVTNNSIYPIYIRSYPISKDVVSLHIHGEQFDTITNKIYKQIEKISCFDHN